MAAPRRAADEAPNRAATCNRSTRSISTPTMPATSRRLTPNSPEVREAWLRRVRELIVEGNQQQALDSLHEFQRRYPDHPLPDDLQRFQQSQNRPRRSVSLHTLAAPAAHAIEVKHRPFLAQAARAVYARSRARLAGGEQRRRCYAQLLGVPNRRAIPSSDDSEPAGTAGRPILAAIDGQGLDQVVVVVTRWYRRHQSGRRRAGARLRRSGRPMLAPCRAAWR